jgi:glycosyltransferase involved in cell wall biosynthesis
MKKILYITDQQEYSQNGTISTLFDIYLKEYFDVHIVFMTKYKHSFQIKGDHFIVPDSKKDDIIEYLEVKNIDISSYAFIFTRNKKNVLKNVLKNKSRFSYKIAHRISYPKKHHKIELLNASNSIINFFKSLSYKAKLKKRDNLVNRCDLFFPSSTEAKVKFYPHIHTKSFPIFVGLDPDKLNEHIISDDKIKKFIYVGSIDELREFDIILDALSNLNSSNWLLTISTTNKEYINNLLNLYPIIKTKITLKSALSLDELRAQINEHDVGIALLPRIDFYDTVVADKVIDYATCALPTLLTSNSKNHTIFEENEAIFSEFNVIAIQNKLEEIINIPNNKLATIGNRGQKKLLSLKRNYKTLAKELAQTLNQILDK